jgi:hypothetical protein
MELSDTRAEKKKLPPRLVKVFLISMQAYHPFKNAVF